jgi:hypothetical protein
VEPPVVLDRAAVQQDLEVLLGRVAQQVALAERRVLQAPVRPQVQLEPLLALSQQWALQSLVLESWVLLVRPLSLRRW